MIPVSPFHTELIASVIVVSVVVAAVVIFYIYLFVGSFDDPERGGYFTSEAQYNREQEFYYEILLLLLDFQQRFLIFCWIFDKGF